MIYFEYFKVTDPCVHDIQTDQCSDWLDAERQAAVSKGPRTKTTRNDLSCDCVLNWPDD